MNIDYDFINDKEMNGKHFWKSREITEEWSNPSVPPFGWM